MYLFYNFVIIINWLLLFFIFFSFNYMRLLSFFSLSVYFICFYFLFFTFNKSILFYQFIYSFYYQFKHFNYYFIAGIDGISIFFIILSAFLLIFCLLSYWFLKYRLYVYFICLFFSLFLLFNVFTTLDFIYFYIFFECVVIPMFLLIGIFGSRSRKIYAAYQFFLYTLVGSVFILLCLLNITSYIGISSFSFFSFYFWNLDRIIIIWVILFLGFSVKVPIVPLHIWLPEAHVEAPTPASVMLAGILLKLAPYAMIRLLLNLFFYIYTDVIFFILTIAIMSFFFSALISFNQIDIKKIIAYSSVSHMNYALLGLFSKSLLGLLGIFYLLLGHAITSGALFLVVGILYDRYRTRLVFYFSSLVIYMPVLAILFFILILANFGFPLTANFVGEFLVLLGIFKFSSIFLIVILIGMLFNLVFSLFLYNILFFGVIKVTFIRYYCDIIRNEFLILVVFVFLIILFGLFPYILLDVGYLPLLKYNIKLFLLDTIIT